MDVLKQLDKVPGIPKKISPRQHSYLDYLTVSGFLIASGLMWNRNRRGAIAALINGLFVLGYTPLTDFSGNGERPISFRTHGKLDIIQAGMAAAAPTVLAFSGKHSKSTLFFRSQAMNEALVLRMTDFEAAEPADVRLRRAA
jgi:Na+/proline symporter